MGKLESEMKNLLLEDIDIIIKEYSEGLTEILRGIVVDLAGNTPFDTGYHAINWQLTRKDTDKEVEKYDKKKKRNFQSVLDNVSNRANSFKYSLGKGGFLINNGKMIEELEKGTPTAGTGKNANPGFVEGVMSTFSDRVDEIENKLKGI